jgi:cell fate regulator YaaT (PSP1 superfamily)
MPPYLGNSMFAKTKKIYKRLKRTSKNKKEFKQCGEQFCKKKLMKLDKMYKKNAKKYNIPYNPSKQDNESRYYTCTKHYCNEKCIGYPNKPDQFNNEYTPDEITTLKESGALSGCIFNPNYIA